MLYEYLRYLTWHQRVSSFLVSAMKLIIAIYSADELSPDEEKLLAMYIAKYNAELEGREDTRLYKLLVNSVSRVEPMSRPRLNAIFTGQRTQLGKST